MSGQTVRVRTGIAKRADGRWFVIARGDGEGLADLSVSRESWATEAEAEKVANDFAAALRRVATEAPR